MPASKAASVQARVCSNSTPPEKVSHEPREISETSRSEEPSLRNLMTTTVRQLRYRREGLSIPLSQGPSELADRWHSVKTMTWTSDELSRIETAEELQVAPRRRDGTLRTPVPIWVVRVGEDVYVRAAYGPGTGWHRVARASREGRIRAGGVEKDVTMEDADGAVNDQVDAAYRAKYRRYPGSIVDGITNAQARSSTLRLAPRT
jgi:hypothetical protein